MTGKFKLNVIVKATFNSSMTVILHLDLLNSLAKILKLISFS